MSGRDSDGLIARIRQVRRAALIGDQSAAKADDSHSERLHALEARVAHLEQLVEGLQDSVHRESDRHEKLISEIDAKIQPGAMGAALADDARHRGL